MDLFFNVTQMPPFPLSLGFFLNACNKLCSVFVFGVEVVSSAIDVCVLAILLGTFHILFFLLSLVSNVTWRCLLYITWQAVAAFYLLFAFNRINKETLANYLYHIK